MKSGDVTDTLDLALQASGCDQATVLHKPRLLSEQAIEGAIGSSTMASGSSYISGELANWLKDRQIDHVRSAPYPPRPRARSRGGTRL
jgi:transposase InsO family protein